jgi:hypothetical protein
MATMHMFRSILDSRGLDAAANYAAVAQFDPGILEARRLREETKGRPAGLGFPSRVGKTKRDRMSGATARRLANQQERCRQRSPSTDSQSKKGGKKVKK